MAALGAEPSRGHVARARLALQRARRVRSGNLIPHFGKALRRALCLQQRPRFFQGQLRLIRHLSYEAVGDSPTQVERGFLPVHVDRHRAARLDVTAQCRRECGEESRGGWRGRLGGLHSRHERAIRAHLLEKGKTSAALAKHPILPAQVSNEGSGLESMPGNHRVNSVAALKAVARPRARVDPPQHTEADAT